MCYQLGTVTWWPTMWPTRVDAPDRAEGTWGDSLTITLVVADLARWTAVSHARQMYLD